MNTATLVGRLATDPELRSTSGGNPVVSFRLAVRNRHRDNDDFFTIVAWGELAKLIADHKTTGQRIAIDGRLTPQTWEDNGQRRSRVVVTAEEVEFLDQPRSDTAATLAPAEREPPVPEEPF
jgi:single-strand DNA-binding protein